MVSVTIYFMFSFDCTLCYALNIEYSWFQCFALNVMFLGFAFSQSVVNLFIFHAGLVTALYCT